MWRSFMLGTLVATSCLLILSRASAASLASDQGDIAWVLLTSALVRFMTPGVAYFYGGLVRNKNVISWQRTVGKRSGCHSVSNDQFDSSARRTFMDGVENRLYSSLGQ